MSDFGINEMLEMQRALQEKYVDKLFSGRSENLMIQ